MTHQYATVEDTLWFFFAANDTSGSGGDGANPRFDVRRGGAAQGSIPVLSGDALLLDHANYPSGCHEIVVEATGMNGFSAGFTYGVFCTIAIDGQNPTRFVGSFTLAPMLANVVEIGGSAQRATDLALIARYLFANGVDLTNDSVVKDSSVVASALASAGNISGYAKATDSLQNIRDVISEIRDLVVAGATGSGAVAVDHRYRGHGQPPVRYRQRDRNRQCYGLCLPPGRLGRRKPRHSRRPGPVPNQRGGAMGMANALGSRLVRDVLFRAGRLGAGHSNGSGDIARIESCLLLEHP